MSLDAWRDRDLPEAAREGYMIGGVVTLLAV
jgi:hypothetical protein